MPASRFPAPSGRNSTAEEESLAGKLVDSLSGSFDPDEFHDTYQEQVRKLVEAKSQGKKPPTRKAVKRKRQPGTLPTS